MSDERQVRSESLPTTAPASGEDNRENEQEIILSTVPLPPSSDPSETSGTLPHISIPTTKNLESGQRFTISAITNAGGIPGYELLSQIGKGGMGVVYKARQTALNRIVALKQLRHARMADPEDFARFRAEAEAIAQLQHPNIVAIYEIGEHDGVPFFSLEYCSGGTLERRIQQQLPDPRQAAEIVETLARAIAFAHRHRIIHRDLKPSNVLLSEDGVLKIGDFGIAKRLDRADRLQQEELLGTPAYVAPEQIEGRGPIGPAVDIYALGAILYECLTGRPPFEANTVAEVLLQVRQEEPKPLRDIRPHLPRDLEWICWKCLQKTPTQRYATATELAEDLRNFLDGRPVLARPMTRLEWIWRTCKHYPQTVAVATIVVLTLALSVFVAAQIALEARLSEREAISRRDAVENVRDQVLERVRVLESENAALAQQLSQTQQQITLLRFQLVGHLAADAPQQAWELLESIPPEERDWLWYHWQTEIQSRLFGQIP